VSQNNKRVDVRADRGRMSGISQRKLEGYACSLNVGGKRPSDAYLRVYPGSLGKFQRFVSGFGRTSGSLSANAGDMRLPTVYSTPDSCAQNEYRGKPNHPTIQYELSIFVLLIPFVGFRLLALYIIKPLVKDGNSAFKMKATVLFPAVVCGQRASGSSLLS
jgi:hypothetical protein